MQTCPIRFAPPIFETDPIIVTSLNADPSSRESSNASAGATLNIAQRLHAAARKRPFDRAVVFPAGRDSLGRVSYTHLTFEQLDQESDRLARGLQEMGVRPGTRMVLMVRPSLEFIALTFALFKAGAVSVLIDPGMGRSRIFQCLEEVQPDGFVAIPIVHMIRRLNRRRFSSAKLNVTVGRKLFRNETGYADLLGGPWTPFEIAPTAADDPAAIIFTSGSTGPPKGVAYEHGMFDAQVELLRDFYDIQPGEIDLPGFPLFALFNAAMEVTTVIPDMDPTRPADVDPVKIIEAIENHGVTQAFGSPALWNRVGRYCEEHGIRFRSLKRVLSAGAPVPGHVIRRMRACLPEDGDIHTPYGATESLPVASISGREVLEETSTVSRTGGGTCVGRLFPRMHLKIVEMRDGPLESLDECRELEPGEIGEIIVRGPVTTRQYDRRPEATAAAKIPDGNTFWHRMGDVGYRDDEGRLWFCGRKAHVVETGEGLMFSIRCEAIFNDHPAVYRSALVGIGDKPAQRPVIVIEPEAGEFPRTESRREEFRRELLELAAANPLTASIGDILFHESLPVDIRHNVKIFREKLVPWAAERLRP